MLKTLFVWENFKDTHHVVTVSNDVNYIYGRFMQIMKVHSQKVVRISIMM